MLVQIDLKSGLSIHDQLVENIKELIVLKVLKAEEKLPTVREMAAQLTINPNTIQKAYRELENQKYIYAVQGRGCYVMPVEAVKDSNKIANLTIKITKLIEEAKYLEIEKKNIISIIDNIFDSLEE